MTKSDDTREWFTPVWVVPVLLALVVAVYSVWGIWGAPAPDPHVIAVPPVAGT